MNEKNHISKTEIIKHSAFQTSPSMSDKMEVEKNGAEVPKVKLITSDEKEFTVSKDLACMSVTLSHMLGDVDCADSPIPVPNVSSVIMEKVIEYCQYHLKNPDPPSEDKKDDKRTDNISPWDQKFCSVDQGVLFDLILAANYLDIKPLLDVTCKTVANMIKGRTVEEIRKMFNIINDFTPEEEEQIRKENAWCEDR